MDEKGIPIPIERIEKSILLTRGQKVMLDKDLANLYKVETRRLNQAVRRNIKRFPKDFMLKGKIGRNDQVMRWPNLNLEKITYSLSRSRAVTEFLKQLGVPSP